eukprot:gene24288-29503_t
MSDLADFSMMFPSDRTNDETSKTEHEQIVEEEGEKLYIVSSAEAYAMVAGSLFESLLGRLPTTHVDADWTEVHLRQLVAVVKEQKRFTSMSTTSKEDAVATDERVFNDMAYMLGAIESRSALLVCLTKKTETARACAKFLQKLSSSNTGPTLAIVDVNEVA